MKKRWMVGVAVWLLAIVAQAAPPAGIPYRMLWHAYNLGMRAADAEKRMSIRSKDNVDPRTFSFTPTGADGRSVLACDKDGFCTVRWDPAFYAENTLIASDQPKGSLKLNFGWNFSFNSRLPVGVNLAVYGRLYVESGYHWVMLSQAWPKR